MNPDAFGGEEAVKDRSKSGLVEQHEAKLRKQDAQSAGKARAARTRKISRRFRTCPAAAVTRTLTNSNPPPNQAKPSQA